MLIRRFSELLRRSWNSSSRINRRHARIRLVPRDVGRRLEELENRCLLAAVTWDAGGDGTHWSDLDNLSTNVLPTSADDVTIDFGSNTIQHDSGTDTVNSLTTSNNFSLTGGTLIVNAASSINGNFTLLDDTQLLRWEPEFVLLGC